MELKSTASSLTYWRKDFEDSEKKKSFEIKKCQIEGLTKAAKYPHVIAGFYINFRNVNKTYYLSIQQFHALTDQLPKKSINHADVAKFGIEIEQKLMKKNYKYNLRKFFDDITSV